jgi:alpha-D-ribose 1-methylphosphonate 5-triphosphate diphosphatase PhnM
MAFHTPGVILVQFVDHSPSQRRYASAA